MKQRLQRLFWSWYGRLVWDSPPFAQNEVLSDRIAEILRARQRGLGETALDAGCGTGNHAVALARVGFRVTGIDYAAGMLERAVEKVPRELRDRIEYRQENLDATLPISDESFDHAISISVLQVVGDPGFTLRELARVLKPGGTLVVAHFPRPAVHDLPLRTMLTQHLAGFSVARPWQTLLAVTKMLGERWGGTRYWGVSELRSLLEGAGFNFLRLQEGSPILAIVEKIDAREHAA